MRIYFTISLDGRFVFRTDTFDSEWDASRCLMHLSIAFTKAGGYRIDKMFQSAAWNTVEVTLDE